MDSENQMGDVTKLAYNFIKEDLLIMNDELDPAAVLDFLQDGDNFKRVSDLLKETMINARIPRDTKKRIKNYATVDSFLCTLQDNEMDAPSLCDSDPSEAFVNSLFALLSKQEDECLYQKRKYQWNRPTISRWFSDTAEGKDSKKGSSESIRNRDDAIAICFALGIDYVASREFMNKCGHAIFNIRNPEDAVYIYCFLSHRPLSAAKEMIHKYYTKLDDPVVSEGKIQPHSGDTTQLLANQILKHSSWKTDDEFFDTFLLPNKANFISYSKTALKEYYKIKNPIYLSALKTIVADENNDYAVSGFDLRKIQEHIHKFHKDRPITIPMTSVQITYNFINNLEKYSTKSALLKEAYDMLDIHVVRINEKGWREEDFKTINNSVDVIDHIANNISSFSSYSGNDSEQKILSDFLTETVTAYKMLCTWLPSVVIDDKDGNEYEKEYIDSDGCIKQKTIKKDARQRAYSQSVLKDSVLSSFPHRNFFTQFEKHPEKLVHDMSIRKAIILLFYMNYARNLIQDISNPNTTDEMQFGFESFKRELDEVLGKCQLGKLYPANQFDWLILESIKELDNHCDEDDIGTNPILFLDKIISFSFGALEDADDD